MHVVVFAFLFLLGAAAGLALSREGGNIAAFWPPNAILLGLLLRARRQDLTLPIGACALTNVALNLLFGDPLPVAAGFAAANMLEVAVAYLLIARFVGLPLRICCQATKL